MKFYMEIIKHANTYCVKHFCVIENKHGSSVKLWYCVFQI